VREYEVTGEHVYLSLWFDRTRTPAWGLFGGKSGSVPEVILQPDTSEARLLLKVNHLPLPAGTIFRVASGGGGGYGLPDERPVEWIMEDVIDGYISRQVAETDYGMRSKLRQLFQVDEQGTPQPSAPRKRKKKRTYSGWW
jgi:N-methylhydantoinase B